MIFGFQPNENFNIYAGPVYQTIKGNVQLRGLAYGSANGLGLYNADLMKMVQLAG
jgi:long-chain fatty acid transport protein